MTGLGFPFTQMTVGSGTQCSTHEAVSVGNTVVGGTGASVGKCQTGGGTNSVVVVVVGEAPRAMERENQTAMAEAESLWARATP